MFVSHLISCVVKRLKHVWHSFGPHARVARCTNSWYQTTTELKKPNTVWQITTISLKHVTREPELDTSGRMEERNCSWKGEEEMSRLNTLLVRHGPKSIMVAVIGQSHHRILAPGFLGGIFTRIGSFVFEDGFSSKWKDSTSDEVCRWPVIVFSHNFLGYCRQYSTSSQAVQYGGFSPRAMINERVCFLTLYLQGSKKRITPFVLWRVTVGF